MTRTLRTALTLAAAAALLAGCGDREEIVHEAETEGIYVDVGPLDYQVQISRQLNPRIVPDRSYLLGVPEFVGSPADDETWFAVFLRVQNQTDEPHEAAGEFSIVDTQDKVYRPIEIDPEQNPVVYRPDVVPPGEVVPSADSLAGDSPTQGRLLLFKVTYQSLQNRPLTLRIEGEDGEEGDVVLDI